MPRALCRVTPDPLDVASLLDATGSPEDGAVLVFFGVVRNHNEGRAVDHLDYHAYVPMAEATLHEIATEAQGRWPIGDITVEHRIGTLAIGEPSVAIAVAAPHRGAAYDASRYIIEELKKRVPIWKKEGYLSGEREWVAP